MKLLNQYTSRTVPGYVNVLGTATNTATVSLWSPESTALYASTTRKGEYFRGELPFHNSTNALWLTITNVAVWSNSTGADIVTNTLGRTLLAKTPETFTYDTDGNLTSDSLWTNVWNGENRRSTIESRTTLPAGAKVKEVSTHLADGRWIERVVSTNNGTSYYPASTNRYVWDGQVLLAVLDHTNGVVVSFIRGLDLSGSIQGAGGVGGVLAVKTGSSAQCGAMANSTHFTCYDGNGNVAALVNATTGAESARYEYGAFAERLRETGPMAKLNPIRFSTQYSDDVIGDVKYLFRDYDADTGRWPNRDPIEEQGGANLYGFVGNDPIGNYDVLGLFDTGSQGRTDAVKNRATVRADVKNMVDNMLASRDKSCTKGKAIERKRFKPASDTSYAFMYFTGYFLLGQVSVPLDGKGYYEVDCCKQKFGKWEIVIHGSFRDKFDELIPTLGIGGRKGVGSLPLTFVGEWVEFYSGSE